MSYDSHGVHHHDHLCRCPMCRPQPPDEPRTLDLSDVLRSEWLDGGGLAVLIGHMTDEQLVQALHVLVKEVERRATDWHRDRSTRYAADVEYDLWLAAAGSVPDA